MHEQYPRALPHEPLVNYRALSPQQLGQKHQQFAGEVAQGRRTLEPMESNKDSHNNVDQGWPRALAQQRQAGRVQQGANELWRDIGHLGAIREAYKERGLTPPELPAELKPRNPQAAPTRSNQTSLTPEQQRHHALAREQLAPGLRARGLDDERIDRVSAAAVSHAQAHAHRGEVRAFHLSKPMQDEIFPDKEHFGRIFRNNARMSSMGIPQISAIMGSCVAGGAYLPIMSDEGLIVDGTGSIFLAGPYLVKAAIGEEVDQETLGGARIHCEISGVTDYRMPDDTTCLQTIRKLVSKIGKPEKAGFDRVASRKPRLDPIEISGIMPENPAKPYDMLELLKRLVDDSDITQYKAESGFRACQG